MAFTFDPIFAADPSNAANVASNASILIFNPADAGKAPIALTDVTGAALPNPITVNKNGFGPAFTSTLDRVAWSGGGFTGFFTSYEGIKAVATAAQAAAEAAAATAGTDAAAVATAAIGTATDDAAASAASASASATAAANAAALVGAPADAAITAAINSGASATNGALKSNFMPKWQPNTAYLANDKVLSPNGDVLSAKINFTTGATYNPANWDTPLSATYVPKWKANTAYLAGDKVVSPNNDVVSAVAGFTSGASYDATKWSTAATARIGAIESTFVKKNTVGFIGDSITAGMANGYIPGGYQTSSGDSPGVHAMTQSVGNWTLIVNAGVGGQRSDQILARLQNDIINAGCGVCVITSFYFNNLGQGRSQADTIADLAAMIALLRNAGVAPIICLPTPDAQTGSTSANRLWLRQIAVKVTELCRTNSVPVIDPFPALVSVSTGLLDNAYNLDSSVHPNAAGYKVFGKILADYIDKAVPAGPVAQAATAVDPTDLLGGKGLFLTDTAGVGTGFTAGADPAFSIVTDPLVAGRMQQISVTGGTAYKDMLVGNLGTEFAAGNVLELSGILTASGGTAVPRIRFIVNGAPNPNTYPTFEPRIALTRGRFAMRWVVPAGTTSVYVRYWMQTGTGTASLGQLTVKNLSV